MTLYSSKREIFSPKPKIYSDILLIFEQGLSAFALSTVYMKELAVVANMAPSQCVVYIYRIHHRP